MNPNFKPHMITDKLLKACEEQVQKYFGEREMDAGCLICGGTRYKSMNCKYCPLGDGSNWLHNDHGKPAPCTFDISYIHGSRRETSTYEARLRRGNRLIKILDKSGITIYDEEVEK